MCLIIKEDLKMTTRSGKVLKSAKVPHNDVVTVKGRDPIPVGNKKADPVVKVTINIVSISKNRPQIFVKQSEVNSFGKKERKKNTMKDGNSDFEIPNFEREKITGTIFIVQYPIFIKLI